MTVNEMEHDADVYLAELQAASTSFRLAHPELWRKMLDGVTEGYHIGDPYTFASRMGVLDRKCAQAAGFPDFATWLNRKYAAAA